MELRDAHIIAAVKSSGAMEALLDRFVELAGPNKGAPVLLAALARMGTAACEWVDGELRIELVSDGGATKISCSSSIGAGFSERIFRDKTLKVPFDEFPKMIARVPKLVEPLKVKQTEKRLVLSASSDVRKTTMPPPMVEIDESSLVQVPRPAKPAAIPPPLPATARAVPPPLPVSPAAPKSKPGEKKVVLRRRVRDEPNK